MAAKIFDKYNIEKNHNFTFQIGTPCITQKNKMP